MSRLTLLKATKNKKGDSSLIYKPLILLEPGESYGPSLPKSRQGPGNVIWTAHEA
jgi:hypothetical protein